MDIYLLFQVLSVASLLTSTAFDILQFIELYDVYLVLSFIFLFITSLIPFIFKHDPDFKDTVWGILKDRNF